MTIMQVMATVMTGNILVLEIKIRNVDCLLQIKISIEKSKSSKNWQEK